MIQPEQLITTYKILFIGDTSVGKTNLISRFVNNEFSPSLLSTICVEQSWKKVPLGERMVHFEFNDTASQEYLRSGIDSYYEEADCYVIVFDMTRKATFDSLSGYFESIKVKYKKANPKIFLVGTKMDQSNKEIKKDEAIEYATHNKAPIFFASAKDNQGVKELFHAIYKEFLGEYETKGEDYLLAQGNARCDCCILC